jgi:transposase
MIYIQSQGVIVLRPISNEKRELIIEAKQRGEKEGAIATWLKISKRSVGTIWKLFRNTGGFQAAKYTGRKSRLSSEKIDEISSALNENPDITLNELIERLSLPIKKSQLSKLLIKLGFSYKKKLSIRKNSFGTTSSKNVPSGWMSKKN